jgi:hypothetical protein
MRWWLVAMVVAALALGWRIVGRDDGRVATAQRGVASDDGPAARPAVIAALGDSIDGHSGKIVGPHVLRLARIALPGGAIVAQRTLGRRARGVSRIGRANAFLTGQAQLLAATPDGQTVQALVRQPPGARDVVVTVDAASLATRRSYPLRPGVRYAGVVFARSGRLFAYGTRRGPRGSVPVVTILDTATGAIIGTHVVPGRARRDWSVYWAAVSADERRLMLTYHGGNTTGADWLDVSGGAFTRCPSRRYRNRACVFEVHGSITPYRDGFLATTGSEGPFGKLIQIGADGHVTRRLRVRPYAHLMAFGLDADRSVAYISACSRHPAIRSLDLVHGHLQSHPSGRYCGDPLALGHGYLALSASHLTHGGYPDERPPTLRLIDLTHPDAGTEVSRTTVPLDAVMVGHQS